MPVVGGVIYLTSPMPECEFQVIAREDCPPDTIYFLPNGSRTWNLATGETLEVAPGYYVNPRRLGVITGIS